MEIQIICLVTCCFVNILEKNNVLAINSRHNLAVDPLQTERSEHALPPIGPALQVYHKHLRTFNTHKDTHKHMETHTQTHTSICILVPEG